MDTLVLSRLRWILKPRSMLIVDTSLFLQDLISDVSTHWTKTPSKFWDDVVAHAMMFHTMRSNSEDVVP